MIERTQHGDVAVITIENGKANALTADLLDELTAAVVREVQSPARGLVLTGAGSMFSAGLDLLALENASREDIAALGGALADAAAALFSMPRPTVAAINGHCIAGGAILALACDQRIMAEGKGKFGLTEAQLGLTVPPSIIEMLRYPLSRPLLERVLYTGTVYPTFKAQDMQLVDTVVEPDELMARCVTAIEDWTPNVNAFADVKGRLHAPILARMDAARDDDAAFVDRWFSDDAQAAIRAQIKTLRGA